ncbi:trafficking protein particle complex subunit 10 [Chironomus tepperi]|uniref:trafficking protein particle complex subunit 10 n=1 Tax=Chironomus tepperi TaxID=113505 RepID=UPI00391EFB3D
MMNLKPLISYSGDNILFKSIQTRIEQALPTDKIEWKRSYGRGTAKNIKLEANFKTFESCKAQLESYNSQNFDILKDPSLHIYISECNDVETYKGSLKEEIDSWLKQLTTYGISDWMILIVETIDMKKTKNILPRQSVLDKIRLDFGAKNADRCVSILNPLKFENKATESFRSMIQRIRHLILSAYNKNIIKFEEIIRARREERNNEDWNFITYFLLQEKLAFVLEMLTLYSDALVQYDELDAMLNLFIMNTMYGEKPKWMSTFEKPLNNLRGITMCKKDIKETRQKIIDNSITIIELRNYVFQRQCTLLNSMEHQWEIAQRLFPFLFSTLREIDALRLETFMGTLSCWQFINCLEVLNLCDCVVGTENIIKCSQHTASIWNLAKDKLYELGKLCGLLPGSESTSEQLHIVVQLSSSIGESPERDELEKKELEIRRSHSPSRKVQKPGCERLREALQSNVSFQKLYLELCELAISTYKHVSRLRSARYVGRDLGNFYCALNEPHKAIVFFTDLLRELKSEKWNALASQTLLELANCYKKLDDSLSYTKVCAAISCCVDLEILVRTFYFDDFLKSLKSIQPILTQSDKESNNFIQLEDHFKVIDVHLVNSSPIIQDSLLTLELRIDSNFPREVLCETVSISFELLGKNSEAIVPPNEFDILPFSIETDLKQDNTINMVSVICESKAKVRRTSSGKNDNLPVTESNFKHSASAKNILVHPGVNVIVLETKALEVGTWILKQIAIHFQKLKFLSKSINVKNKPFEISTKSSSASLHFSDLVAGLDQSIKLFISGGSYNFPKESSIQLKCSKGLRLKKNGETDYQKTLNIKLTDFKLFEERTVELTALCELPCRRDETLIDQKVLLHCPWSEGEIQIPLKFLPILTASCRLHSSGSKKFLQVIVKSLYEKTLILTDAVMKCLVNNVMITDLNPKSQSRVTIMKNISISYLYEIEVEPLKTINELPVISIEFNAMYAEEDHPDVIRRYICPFDVTDYNTLFHLTVKIVTEPQEICRVGTVCHLHLTIKKLTEQNQCNDLMYEVLFDQNMWALYGRSAGVVTMADDVMETTITLDVFPLIPGFLPLPNIRLSKYIANKTNKTDNPKLVPFAPTQVYNSTKSLQIHVLNNVEQQ